MIFVPFPRQTVEGQVSEFDASNQSCVLTADDSLFGPSSPEAIDDAFVRSGEPARLEHRALVLDEKFDALVGANFVTFGSAIS